MQCALCGRTTYAYTGMLNPWYECRECGALYCDRCSRGQAPEEGYATEEDLYQVANLKTCVSCNSGLRRK